MTYADIQELFQDLLPGCPHTFRMVLHPIDRKYPVLNRFHRAARPCPYAGSQAMASLILGSTITRHL